MVNLNRAIWRKDSFFNWKSKDFFSYGIGYFLGHCGERSDEAVSKLFIYICSFCLEAKEPKVQDLEIPAKNNLHSIKILKLARIYYLFFGSEFVSRFKQ
ncbi:hypothetical protein AR686_14785 [Chryseobacterium aquaticum subsp. greenlandense]|uniref:Uncharacterized protein n=1 Tax=Chryseobacterium aquaticum subsp. greenlandense TaxID=345663 RepID=A0A101CER8_9FLAO|nr:hypothetical protein AR686_14785 [Chryseobacterium aquaticum subsp. greenlandense]